MLIGCGIVEFNSPQDAQKAINVLSETELKGRLIFVREDREERGGGGGDDRGQSRQVQMPPMLMQRQVNMQNQGQRQQYHHQHPSQGQGQGQGQLTPLGCKLYVGNLSWDVKWQELKDFFKPYGTVLRADVIEEHSGRSKGCGKNNFPFVEFQIFLTQKFLFDKFYFDKSILFCCELFLLCRLFFFVL